MCTNFSKTNGSITVGKIFMKIIKNRIYAQLDSNQPPEQAGFRKGLSAIDHIHTVNQLIEKANEYEIELHLVFVDFQKAFDSINHTYLWNALEEQGVCKEILDILKELYKNSKAYIKLDRAGPTFPLGRGVKQGDPLSPNLFNALLEKVFREVDWTNYGIRIDGKPLNHLRFADDIVLISEKSEEVQKMLDELVAASSKAGLEINGTKTKYMSNKKGGEITFGKHTLEKQENFTYLGQIISFRNKMNKELEERRNRAWRGYWALRPIFKGKLRRQTKIRMLESCIYPILLYGAQTWTTTKREAKKLLSTQNSMLRSILKIRQSEKINANHIRRITKSKDIIYTAKKLKFNFAGHIMRESKETWSKRLTTWVPYGRVRKQGRPALRWRDEIDGRVGIPWNKLASDREAWRRTGEAFAREWGPGI